MTEDKRTTMVEAIGRIDPGSSIALGLALEHAIPFAAGHELVRRGIDDLTLIGPISDTLFDQLVGAGLVSRIRAAWVGNVSVGSGYRFREAVEADAIAVENHSNLSVATALEAGRLGVPYLPTKSLLGSDIVAEGPFEVRENPFAATETEKGHRTDRAGDEQVVLVPSIQPDWAIVHVQRANEYGDAHVWGNTGLVEAAVAAADDVLVTAEEVVPPEVIASDPSRVAVTREQVTAIVECPFGAHPSPVAGYYRRDHDHFVTYGQRTRTQEGFDEWADEWIHGVADREEYLERTAVDRDALEPANRTSAAEVTYGR